MVPTKNPTPTDDASCPFCERIASGNTIAQTALAVAIADAYPVSPGHTLIIPRRHEADFFRLTVAEHAAMFDLLCVARDGLTTQHKPDGFNIGVNVGSAAGQTIAHAHLHLIPRYKGDVEDPRGGIRWIVPTKAAYWQS